MLGISGRILVDTSHIMIYSAMVMLSENAHEF
jgi:hypothetical protein